MPFKSEKQRKYLWANEPGIARDWTNTYGSGIAKALGGRIPFKEGGFKNWLGEATGYTQHNINNQLLKDALAAGQITEEQYKKMGGYDVAQNMPNVFGWFGKPAGVAAASTLYQGAKKGAGFLDKLGWVDDTMGMSKYGDIGAWKSIGLNTLGSQGLSDSDLALYNNIMTGEAAIPDTSMEAFKKDPVPESRMSPEQRGAIREMMAARSGDYSGLGPHRGMPLSAEDRQAYLAELLANDPASSLYDLSTVKDFSEEENRGRKARMSKGVEGYYSDGTAYVKDLDKLGTRVGPFKGSLADQKLAAVASHELTHPKVEKFDIDMSNIEEPRELPRGGYLHDRTYMPHEKEELLTRMIEMQNFPKTSDAEWYFGQSPYAISKHPSGAEGYEAGKILQRSLEPSLQKYNQLIEAEKRLGLASIKPQTKNWSVFDGFNVDGDFIGEGLTSEEEEEYNEYLRSIGQMPTTKDPNIFQRAIGGIRGGINRANEYNRAYNDTTGLNTNYYAGSLHGNIDNAARIGRRNQGRVNNLIGNYIAGKNKMTPLGLRNRINQLGTQDQINTFNQIQSQPSIDIRSTIVDDHGTSNGGNTSTSTQDYSQDNWSDWGEYARGGRTKYSQGGLASLWPR